MPTLAYAKSQELGLDQDRLNEAFNLLRKWTTADDSPLPGGAILVGRKGRIVEPCSPARTEESHWNVQILKPGKRNQGPRRHACRQV